MELLKRIKLNVNGWSISSTVLILFVLIPNLNLVTILFLSPNENWEHIKRYMLKDVIINTIVIVFCTALLAMLIGTVLAWIISAYDFPLRKFFKWSMILPLSIPPYIAAYTYNGLLGYTGAIQTLLRNRFQLQLNQQYFDVMSIQGAIFIFTICLFPYVYIITKSFLEKQSSLLVETARVLGRNPFEIFLYVVIPISRGAIAGGTGLVILEVLNDYGVVKYFGIPTFSTAIFKTWFGMGDIETSIRLSGVLMVFVLLMLFIERLIRGRRRFSHTTSKIKPLVRQQLKGIWAALATAFCLIIFSLGFLIPVLQLVSWSLKTYNKTLNAEFWKLIFNSLSTALISTSIIIIAAIIIANYVRVYENGLSKLYSKSTQIGYSVPGAIIALGVIMFFINIDRSLYPFYLMLNSNSPKLLLSTSIVMLIFAYIIRFMAIGYNSIDTGFDKIGKKYFEASRMLGMNITETFFKVDLKMIRPAIIGGFLLVLIDLMKELPLTLILRPFNFNTLATKAYEFASDEMVQEAALASLTIIIISIVLTYLFSKIEYSD